MKTMTSDHAGPRSQHHRTTACSIVRAPDPSHEVIALRAYQLYVDCGCPEGRDVEFWLEAEQQLREPLPMK
jgi:hypothetical protein